MKDNYIYNSILLGILGGIGAFFGFLAVGIGGSFSLRGQLIMATFIILNINGFISFGLLCWNPPKRKMEGK